MSLTLDGEMNVSNTFDGEMMISHSLDGEMNSAILVDKHFTYEQARLSDIWLINHNLHKYPSVSVVDTANTHVIGEVEYVDKDNLIVRFAAPFSGYAYLN